MGRIIKDGYELLATGKYKDTTIALIRRTRKDDYMLALGYHNGRWAKAIYHFKSEDEGVNYALEKWHTQLWCI